MLIKLRKAQASLEYAALIGVVVGAIIIMSTYLRRSVEGKIRKEADDIGDNYDIQTGTYGYDSSLTNTEITYTVMGIDGSEVDLSGVADSGFTSTGDSVATGTGVQAQFTEQAGTRDSSETITTE